MNKTDALVAAIGAGVLVVALAGAALTGGGGASQYDVQWTTASAEHEIGEESLQQSGEVAFAFENVHRNTTQLVFTVTGTVPQGHVQTPAAPDSFLVTVAGPDGTEYTGEGQLPGAVGGSTPVEVVVDVGAAPTVTQASGTSPGAANVALDAQYGNSTGTGNWTVTVTLSHPAAVPGAHTFAAVVEANWYSATVQPTVPTTR